MHDGGAGHSVATVQQPAWFFALRTQLLWMQAAFWHAFTVQVAAEPTQQVPLTKGVE
jgi:hypothetical protein